MALQDAEIRKLEEVVEEEEVGDKLAKMVLGEQEESSTSKDNVKDTETALGSLCLERKSEREQYREVEVEHSYSNRPQNKADYCRGEGKIRIRMEVEKSRPERYLHSRHGELCRLCGLPRGRRSHASR